MELTKEQRVFLKSVCSKPNRWRVNKRTNMIDVDVDVYIKDTNLTKLPVKFGKVGGRFYCFDIGLTTLENCPTSVGEDFNCTFNNLTSLEFAPTYVGGYFYCSNNQLTSLEFAPTSVGGGFSCTYNQLTSLEGCSASIGGDFYCSNNQLTDYFKNIKEEDFPHWDKLIWGDILKEYPFLINIGKKHIGDLKGYYLNKFPQTKLYLE